MTSVDVLVVGGGISGLSTAWWLARAGFSVELWEAGDRPGGKILSPRTDGYLTERAAAMVMNFRPEVVELVREAGLEMAKTKRSPVAEARRYLLHQGQLESMPMRLGAFMASPLWSLRGKLRMLAEPFIPASGDENESVSRFISRRLGREVLEKAMEPFVAGTLASDSDRACAASTLPRLIALERRYGSIAAGIMVNRLLHRRQGSVSDTFSFHSGMDTLTDTLARTPGVQLSTRHTVQELVREQSGWRVTATTATGERTLQAAQVVLATPAPVAASLVAGLDAELADLLRGIRYAPVTVVHLGLDRASVRHPLDGIGFLVPRQEGRHLTGNLWMSTLFPNRAPTGKVLLTAYLGGARTPEVRDWNDDHIVAETVRELHKYLGLKAEPEMVRIDRHPQALPLYHGAYQARMQAIGTRLKEFSGLYLEANYQGGVSVRDRIARGRTLAEQIQAAQRHTHGRPSCTLRYPRLGSSSQSSNVECKSLLSG